MAANGVTGRGGESFIASDIFEINATFLEELAFSGAAAPSADDNLVLEAELGISADKLNMYDADTIVALYAVANAMQAIKNGTATSDQVALLKKADSFLDKLYVCCTGNGVANDGTLTVGLIDSFKNFLADLESRNVEGDVPVGAGVILTADDIAEMKDGFITENSGGVYLTDESDFAIGVFDATPNAAVPFPGLTPGAPAPAGTAYPAQPTTTQADAETEAPEEADGNAGGGGEKVAHDHNGDGVRDHP